MTFERRSGGVNLVLDRETLRVEAWGRDTIGVQALMDGRFATVEDAQVDPWNTTTYPGGRCVALPTPMDRMPTLVRVGADLPIDGTWFESPSDPPS